MINTAIAVFSEHGYTGTDVGLVCERANIGGSSFYNPVDGPDALVLRPQRSSSTTSAFNVGNAIGPALGAAVIALGWGFRAPVVVAIGLSLASLVVVAVAIRVERAWSARNCATMPEQSSGAVV